jgi:ATP synthase protein I
MAKSMGAWAFLIGVILALVVGAFTKGSFNAIMALILVVIGIIVGFMNVSGKEIQPFMMAGVVLALISYLGGNVLKDVAVIGPYLNGMLFGVLVLFTPATIIVALKSVFELAKD